mgnify:CR=1 FL=1
MYINTFKYTPKDVSCQLCTEYVKKLGCTALRCPWLAERILRHAALLHQLDQTPADGFIQLQVPHLPSL